MDANSRLALIRVKTERAKKHFSDLEREAEAFRGVYEYAVLTEDDMRRSFQKVPVSDFKLIACAGDVIHNLRAALDHLAWHLVEAAGNVPDNGCGFPIADSVKKFEEIKVRKMAGMTTQTQEVIEGLRPYKGGNEPLWKIHKLDIVDKHRGLIVVGDKYLTKGAHFNGHFLAIADGPTDFPGIFANSGGNSQTAIEPSSIKTKMANMQPLIPQLNELCDFTDNLIESFLPLLGWQSSTG